MLKRPRLNSKLLALYYSRIITVIAPAGFGKTTFLCEALENCNGRIAWVSLDELDDHFIQFWFCLITSLQRSQPNIGAVTLELLQQPEPQIRTAITPLINQLAESSEQTIIVLDDYQWITKKEIHESIEFFLEYLPAHVHLIISSRVDPPISLARYRGQGTCLEISKADLQFSNKETILYIHKVLGVELTGEQIEYVLSRTQGWIAGLQMIAITCQDNPDVNEFLSSFRDPSRDIMEYFGSEVLDQQEEDSREFLLMTSIFNQLDPDLCNWVLERRDGDLLLKRLVSRNLFIIPLDNERQIYRYHDLFKEILLNELRARHPGLLPTLHMRASEYFDRKGMNIEAIQYAFKAENPEYAAAMIQRVAFQFLGRSEKSYLREWFAKLPEDIIVNNFRLCLAAAMLAETERRFSDEEHFLISLKRINRNNPASDNREDLLQASGLAATLFGLGEYYQGNFEEAVEIAQESLEILPENEQLARTDLFGLLGAVYWSKGDLNESYRYWGRASRMARELGNTILVPMFLAGMAHVQFSLGNFQAAEDLCIDAIQPNKNTNQDYPAACYGYLLLGEIYYQKNRLAEAEIMVQRAILLGQTLPEPIIGLSCYLAQCRIALARDDFDEAVRISRFAKRAAQELGNKYSFLVDVFLSYLAIRLGNIQSAANLAREWIDSPYLQAPLTGQNDQVWNDIRDIWWESPYVTLLRICSLPKSAYEISNRFEDISRLIEKSKSVFQRNEWMVANAIRLYSNNQVNEALAVLQAVLGETEREGLLRIYLDEGEPILELLRAAKSRGIAPHYTKKILHSFSPSKRGVVTASAEKISASLVPHEIPAVPKAYFEPLSKRETEIIQLMQLGLSNREISEKLIITLSTVKNHTTNIYQKLEVNSRGKAIKRAVELGYL